jgi:competence protein ComEA
MVRTLVASVVAALLTAPAAVVSARQSQAAAPAQAEKPSATVNINTASSAEFESLPGIGPKLAQRIIEYREKNGGFKKLEDLMNVQGIGEKNFLKLKSHLSLTPPAKH